MVKFQISNRAPQVKIGGKGTYSPAMTRLVQKANKVIQARFMSNGDIAVLGISKMRRRKK